MQKRKEKDGTHRADSTFAVSAEDEGGEEGKKHQSLRFLFQPPSLKDSEERGRREEANNAIANP